MSDIINLINTKKQLQGELQQEIHKFQLRLHILENKIKNISNEINNLCQHNWIPDRSYCDNDRSTYICSVCECYK